MNIKGSFCFFSSLHLHIEPHHVNPMLCIHTVLKYYISKNRSNGKCSASVTYAQSFLCVGISTPLDVVEHQPRQRDDD